MQDVLFTDERSASSQAPLGSVMFCPHLYPYMMPSTSHASPHNCSHMCHLLVPEPSGKAGTLEHTTQGYCVLPSAGHWLPSQSPPTVLCSLRSQWYLLELRSIMGRACIFPDSHPAKPQLRSSTHIPGSPFLIPAFGGFLLSSIWRQPIEMLLLGGGGLRVGLGGGRGL